MVATAIEVLPYARIARYLSFDHFYREVNHRLEN